MQNGVTAQPTRGRSLVVGFGSSGARHARILTELGFCVSVVSRRDLEGGIYPAFPSIDRALSSGPFEYVVLATETSAHAADLAQLAQSEEVAKILVEKPLFTGSPKMRPSYRPVIHVGYQLRFHPGLRRLRELIGGRRCLMAQFYVGQNLKDWRLDRDARDTYSAYAAKGGGVLRDLSHELDLALWLFGTCTRLTAVGGRLSDVTVDSDDAWSILAQLERCPAVSVQMNYLDGIGQRHITVVAEDTTVAVDMLRGTIECDGRVQQFVCDRDAPIRDMHIAVLEQDGREVCDLDGGLNVVAAIDAVECAGQSGIWVIP